MARPPAYKKDAYHCTKCDRKFSMPGHLARHTSAMHSAKKAGKTARKGKRGRPGGAAAGLALKEMTIEQLTDLVSAAREEAKRRLAALEKALK